MITLNADILATVVATAKRNAASQPRWINAIERAASELANNPYIEALDSHTLLIGSASGKSYTSNGICQCEAFQHGKQPCYHRAMSRLYERYNEAIEQQHSKHIKAQAQDAYTRANARYPNCPLFADRDAETMRRHALAEERAESLERRAKARQQMDELFS